MTAAYVVTLTCDVCGTVAAGEPGADGPEGWLSLHGRRCSVVGGGHRRGAPVHLPDRDVCPTCAGEPDICLDKLFGVKRAVRP